MNTAPALPKLHANTASRPTLRSFGCVNAMPGSGPHRLMAKGRNVAGEGLRIMPLANF